MLNKRQILESLPRTLLLEIARTFELPGLTAKKREEILDALMGVRSIPADDILGTLRIDDLKNLCREHEISPDSWRKDDIIKAVLSYKFLVFSEKKRKRTTSGLKSGAYNEIQTTKNSKLTTKNSSTREKRMARNSDNQKPIEQYTHETQERLNNPPVGLVTPDTDKDLGKKKYEYDPHLDPQLVWAGKTEHTSFEVPTVSLHVHERIDPKRIIEQVRKEEKVEAVQESLFAAQERPLREAIEFYKHKDGWTNRLIAGDSLIVMNSLLEKEGMGEKVQMVYFDPPYGIKYGSNFQPFVNKRDVTDCKDDDLTSEPEMLKAFRDTWELGIHSYLTYIRDRIHHFRQLLANSGSLFVQISGENLHHIREILDEVFSPENFVALIPFRKKTMPLGAKYLEEMHDYLLWYAKSKDELTYHKLYQQQDIQGDIHWGWIELTNGTRRKMTKEEISNHSLLPKGSRIFRLVPLWPASYSPNTVFPIKFEGKIYNPPAGQCWLSGEEGIKKLISANRIQPEGDGNLRYVYFFDDFPLKKRTCLWDDTTGARNQKYVVQTSETVIERCMQMTTDPGNCIFDPTCGSGTTAVVAEKLGRRWITCDTSRIAITLAKQRLLQSVFDYFELAQPPEGVSSGFRYNVIPRISSKSIIANQEIRDGIATKNILETIGRNASQITLYDQPLIDNKRKRVTGPFTVEAVPAPTVKSFDDIENEDTGISDDSVTRSGETLRQSEWRQELLKTGVRGKNGQFIKFSRIEPMSGTMYLQAEGETVWSDAGSNTVHEEPKGWKPLKVLICFGPEHAPLEQRTVEMAWQEARPFKPDLLLFCAFQFDEEAAKDIDELPPNIAGMQLLKVQMNADLLTDDLRKKRSSNESFWLIGQPEVVVDSGEWLVDSYGKAVISYGLCKKLSGVDSLAEINRIGGKDISLYAAISERGDLWDHVANAKGGGIGSLEHSGRAGQEEQRRISAVSWNSTGVVVRIGDANNFMRKIESISKSECGRVVNELRRNKQITERASQIAIHSQLKTIHYSQVQVLGFDYYNPKTGNVESGGKQQIAMWMLDTNYDGRSLFPSQVFFPMAGANEGWATLARNLKTEIDEEKIEAYRGTVSIPFEPGNRKCIAIKIVDDRGIESLKIIRLQ